MIWMLAVVALVLVVVVWYILGRQRYRGITNCHHYFRALQNNTPCARVSGCNCLTWLLRSWVFVFCKRQKNALVSIQVCK